MVQVWLWTHCLLSTIILHITKTATQCSFSPSLAHPCGVSLVARDLEAQSEKVGSNQARHSITLASSVNRAVNGGLVGRNWLRRWFQLSNLPLESTVAEDGGGGEQGRVCEEWTLYWNTRKDTPKFCWYVYWPHLRNNFTGCLLKVLNQLTRGASLVLHSSLH